MRGVLHILAMPQYQLPLQKTKIKVTQKQRRIALTSFIPYDSVTLM